MNTAAVIVNFNMPERADALAEYIKAHCDARVYLVDNGSTFPPAKNTNVWMPKNKQTTAGWLTGYHCAKDEANYKFFWFIGTSAEFTVGDPLAPMLHVLEALPKAVGVHPALTPDSTTSWEHMKWQGGDVQYRRVWMIDNIAALWRASFFNKHPFDPELIYAWGLDLELAYHARQEGKSLYICEEAVVRKVTDIGYAMGRMGMTAEDRRLLARENMDIVFTKKYGKDWRDIMYVNE
jgi:hypothetical protein